ncbi:MAG: FadR family transcriptional regulator [Spirochaetales bacterium]|nr:FadR family transcriptional regulator [Spirochaetales bacterium]
MQKDTKASKIANVIENMIVSRRYAPGEELPSQSEFEDMFSASSRSIREAFKQLEAKGLIDVSQGKRAKVKSNNLDRFVESLATTIKTNHSSNRKLILDLVQVRTTLCVSAAREFSRMPDRVAVSREMHRIANRMASLLPDVLARSQEAYDEFLTQESSFLKVLIRSNNNPILNSIYDNLVPLLDTNIRTLKFTYHDLQKRAREFSYISDAIRNGQTDLAVALVLAALFPVSQKVGQKFEE